MSRAQYEQAKSQNALDVGAIGASIGAMIGGPGGAALGGLIGAMLGHDADPDE